MSDYLADLFEEAKIIEDQFIEEHMYDEPEDLTENPVYDSCVHNWAIVLALEGEKKKALQILIKTRGYDWNEIIRLMRLNQFHTALGLFEILDDEDINDEELCTKTICHFLLTGSLDMQPKTEQEQFIAQIIPKQMNIKPLYTEKFDQYQLVIAVEIEFDKRVQHGNTYLLEYISRHRRQAYVQVIFSILLNSLLMEMDIKQMYKILKLPTDYFNEYFHMAQETILYLHLISSQINGSPLLQQSSIKCLNDMIKFEVPHYQQIDNRILESQLHNGLVKAIVNQKIQLWKGIPERYAHRIQWDELQSEQQISGFLDGILIYRNMRKTIDPLLISDLIYDVLIYKLP